ncbi:hypothetical protein NE237_012183 [Protea cynaroides]|uniref:Uncharacterized protein n=1 Tax=Protea cynaroides TaxID=273540 RepID=A0A9Q0JYK2_9MAGN|nr:hypothetical protein NE237_012183 [Protea cynaroides]
MTPRGFVTLYEDRATDLSILRLLFNNFLAAKQGEAERPNVVFSSESVRQETLDQIPSDFSIENKVSQKTSTESLPSRAISPLRFYRDQKPKMKNLNRNHFIFASASDSHSLPLYLGLNTQISPPSTLEIT